MIKWLIKILFSGQFEKAKEDLLSEAEELLDDVRKSETIQYLSYERIDPRTNLFIEGLAPITENRFVISWLNEHKHNCMALARTSLAANDREKVVDAVAQTALIDSLLKDLEDFKNHYNVLLETKENGSKGGGEA